jgi:thioredoxin reductase
MIHDPGSTGGKSLAIAATIDLLVVGGGPAGTAAAIEGAAQGLGVMLVDEHPVPLGVAGEDVPLHFGGAMGAALANPERMVETVIEARPDILAAFEAGVDVRLGATVLGLWVPGATIGWLPGNVALLGEGDSVRAVRFGRAVIATGRRDMGLAFPGWELPGVMGLTAADVLATTYRALEVQAFVMVGAGDAALKAALRLHALGHACRAVIDIGDPQSPLLQDCARAGIPVWGGARPVAARGTGRVDELLVETAQGQIGIACDAVVLGVGLVPVIELFDVAGAAIETDYRRGGHVPRLVEGQRTTLPDILAAGDCCGIWAAKSLDPDIARAEGRRAARQAAGLPIDATPPAPADDQVGAARMAWIEGALAARHVCQCEEVSAAAILGLLPPAYLGAQVPPVEADGLGQALGVACADPDQIKRLTRAGMGACQGRRCREQVECLLARDAGVPLGTVPRATYRYPVRPVSLRQLGSLPEDAGIAAHWDSWFGMAMQWVPHWRVPPRYTAAMARAAAESGE